MATRTQKPCRCPTTCFPRSYPSIKGIEFIHRLKKDGNYYYYYVVETFKKAHKGRRFPYYGASNEIVSLSNCEINFVKGEPELPLTVYIKKLHSWTEFGAAYEKLSGTTEYSTTLPLLPHQFNAWLLGLNKMYESATIYLNNNYLGTFINPPYEMVILPEVSTDNNKLEIAIPNLLVNHIIHLDKEGVQ